MLMGSGCFRVCLRGYFQAPAVTVVTAVSLLINPSAAAAAGGNKSRAYVWRFRRSVEGSD